MFSFFKKKINVIEVQKGKHLEKAEEQSVEAFFQKRMKNRIKKVLGYNWEILLLTDEWLYFGYPKGHKRPKQYVEVLYKVNYPQLARDFPKFKSITGPKMSKTVAKVIREEYPVDHQSTMLQNIQWQAQLLEATILLKIHWVYSADGAPETHKYFDIVLDKNELSLIALNEQKEA